MIALFGYFIAILNSPYSMLVATCYALIIKTFICFLLISYYKNNINNTKPILLLIVMIISSSIVHTYWLIMILYILKMVSMHFSISRIAWAVSVLEHLSMVLFIENLLKEKTFINKLYNAFRLICGIGLIIFLFCISIIQKPLSISKLIFKISYFYIIIISIITIIGTLYATSKKHIPKLLKSQLKTLIYAFITPNILIELIFHNPFIPIKKIASGYAFHTISTILLTYAAYFCARKLIGLRFLNFKEHVEIKYNFNFVKNFKNILMDLGRVTSTKELQHFTKDFFKQNFSIETHKTDLYIRELENNYNESTDETEKKQLLIEYFLNDLSCPEFDSFLLNSKILIRDEIEFSEFYENKIDQKKALLFLQSINADIFIPIYTKKVLIGYITIEYKTRPKKFYGDAERDEMVIFTAYLSSLVNFLRNRNIDMLLLQSHELHNELYHKHQEINQYKESIRSFMRTSHERSIGILIYKNRQFSFGNQIAQNFITCDINIQQRHPLTQSLKQLIIDTQNYKSTQKILYKDAPKPFIMSAIPINELNCIIITLYYPDIADTIKFDSDLLKDPSQWDYLLYLETTESGKLINQLIPGSGETFLDFKINILKAALNRKATLLSMQEPDLKAGVELLHAISLRHQLYSFILTEPEKNSCYAIKLFGLNTIFSVNEKIEPLLEQLNNNGTLYIENIHFLSLETQEYLAEFLKYGVFKIFKSEQKIFAHVKIICSTPYNLHKLVEQKTFSASLFNELKKTSLTMPSLHDLTDEEFKQLSDEIIKQTIKTESLESMVLLHSKNRSNLEEKRPISLFDLRKKIYNNLIKESKQNNLETVIKIQPSPHDTERELAQILMLGKDALKTKENMEFLWKKFNNQTKIALLLGVNRSSVNRRCKEYNLI